MSMDSHDPSALIDIEDLVTGKNEWLNMCAHGFIRRGLFLPCPSST
jgi:hypothetical protein